MYDQHGQQSKLTAIFSGCTAPCTLSDHCHQESKFFIWYQYLVIVYVNIRHSVCIHGRKFSTVTNQSHSPFIKIPTIQEMPSPLLIALCTVNVFMILTWMHHSPCASVPTQYSDATCQHIFLHQVFIHSHEVLHYKIRHIHIYMVLCVCSLVCVYLHIYIYIKNGPGAEWEFNNGLVLYYYTIY